MTNSLSAFSLLEAREDCELCLVGGMYRRRTAAFVGPIAEDTLRTLGIDTAFIGTNGILDGDVSTSNMDEGRNRIPPLARPIRAIRLPTPAGSAGDTSAPPAGAGVPL